MSSTETPSITWQNSILLTQTTPSNRVLTQRNKTFIERLNQTTPYTLRSKLQSSINQQDSQQSPPSQQQENQQSSDSPSTPSIDHLSHLRRRFTFRRSLRYSVQSKGGDIDDGIRSVFLFLFFEKLSLCRYLFNAPSK